MIIFILIVVINAQLEQLRQSELGSTLLETVQLHIQANEPIEELLQLLNNIEDKLIKQKNNLIKQNKVNDCIQKVESVEEQIKISKQNKFDIREEIYTHKPHIEQYQIMKQTKEKEKNIILKNIDICNNKQIRQQQQYEKIVTQLQQLRYDYINQKNPLSLKVDESQLKPILHDLIDYTTDLISLEDYFYDQKKNENQIQIYQQTLNEIEQFILDINDNLQQTKQIVNELELEYNEINIKINQKQEQVNNIKQECKLIYQQNKEQIKRYNNEIQDVQQISNLIEHNYGWLKSQLGL